MTPCSRDRVNVPMSKNAAFDPILYNYHANQNLESIQITSLEKWEIWPYIMLFFTPFQIIGSFYFSRYIVFAMHLNIHNLDKWKYYVFWKAKMTYNLEWSIC
jgi:hypothetical protein